MSCIRYIRMKVSNLRVLLFISTLYVEYLMMARLKPKHDAYYRFILISNI
jgi:hypothetical protein